jgi:3-isopropylmalate/(R)-2-methylmalate dehydratase small subunit
MEPFRVWSGVAAVLDRANVDTDQVIPKRFLKSIERTGFERALFADWRFRPDGSEDPDFVLNAPRYRGATVLVAGPNFGCGSSREHAPWALRDYGFRAVVAPSFADIFRNNCVENGICTAEATEADVARLMRAIEGKEGYRVAVDLEACTVRGEGALAFPFAIAPASRERLLKGADAIALTLEREAAIARFERERERASTAAKTLG